MLLVKTFSVYFHQVASEHSITLFTFKLKIVAMLTGKTVTIAMKNQNKIDLPVAIIVTALKQKPRVIIQFSNRYYLEGSECTN